MKTEQPILITSVPAATDLSKNLFVQFNGAVCGAGIKALGVINADTGNGNQCPVVSKGISLVKSGAAISLASDGSKAIKSDANGKAIEQGGSGEILGYAMDPAVDADELIRVLLV